ncbi:hypothetical protein FOTG_19143 [Fusarium oxysporum f. sp. vasinfectum 25433]|uniref:Uncharacterized protein n=1 Tax=Fusarium oxysporum f. sp. vasinfectum 25433 TaxID=1089449 RepID=X0KUA5_FUSOX|nr:hypothetical protein FOTG_19143 [Fusarium oxysporum f. sp. vasinfectum 25433]
MRGPSQSTSSRLFFSSFFFSRNFRSLHTLANSSSPTRQRITGPPSKS